jgi:cyclopropane fatty-acyl-phospholipid synthase-like methyltransferase
LDIGCGTGLNVAALARAGWEVIGVDFAYLAVRQARKRLRQNNIPRAAVYHADVTRLNWLSGTFDLILDIGCYHSLNRVERGAYRNQVFRLLKRKGKYLLYAHLREDPMGEVGITQEDLALFEAQLVLTERADGSDRGDRKSVWLSFTADRR